MFTNVCRLCTCTSDLLWVFDENMADNMTEIIKVTSGVEINKTDAITQMVCSSCCQVTIKMYKFRTTAIKNDKDLKAQYADYNVAQLRASIARSSKPEPPAESNEMKIKSPVQNPSSTKNDTKTITKYKSMHPSVKELLQKYPNVELPKECLKSHVGVYITLSANEVNKWFKTKNLSEEEIARLKDEAAERPGEKPASKRPNDVTTFTSEKPDSELSNPIKRIRLDTISEVSEKPKVFGVSKPDNFLTSERAPILSSLLAMGTTGRTVTSSISARSPILNTLLTRATTRSEITSNWVAENGNRRKGRFSNTLNDDMEFQNRTSSSIEVLSDSENDNVPSVNETDLFENAEEFVAEDSRDEQSSIRSTADFADVESRSSVDSLAVSTDSKFTTDSSLFSVSHKESSLHVCKICDAQLTGLRHLKNHIKKRHTRCQFCGKRFKTLDLREQHLKTCSINNNSVQMKVAKLELTRVDEIEDIRKKYASAFEPRRDENKEECNEDVEKKKENEKDDTKEKSKKNSCASEPENEEGCNRHVEKEKENVENATKKRENHHNEKTRNALKVKNSRPSLPCDKETEAAVLELEKFLKVSGIFSVPDAETSRKRERKKNKRPVTNVSEIICILDDEPEPVNQDPATKKCISPANNTARPSVIHTPEAPTASTADAPTDSEICIEEAPTISTDNAPVTFVDQASTISVNTPPIASMNEVFSTSYGTIVTSEDSNTKQDDNLSPRMKVVNTELLNQIDTQTNENEILRNILHSSIQTKIRDQQYLLDHETNPIKNGSSDRIKIFKNLRTQLQRYKIPIEIQFSTNTSVSYKPVSLPPCRQALDSLWTNLQPVDLKPVTQKQPNHISRQEARDLISCQQKAVQDKVVPTTNLVWSTPTVPDAAVTNTPVVLNGHKNYTLLLPKSLFHKSLTPHQSPLPVISSVMSLKNIDTEPNTSASSTVNNTTSALVSDSTTNTSNVNNPTPFIRVKNMSELV